jgi:hypothetical protein
VPSIDRPASHPRRGGSFFGQSDFSTGQIATPVRITRTDCHSQSIGPDS